MVAYVSKMLSFKYIFRRSYVEYYRHNKGYIVEILK